MFLRAFSISFLCALLCLCWAGNSQAGEQQRRAVLFLEHEKASPWTDLLKKGLEKGGKDFGFKTEVLVVSPEAGQEEAFRKTAADAGLILVATDNFHEILRNNAANFRRVKFGCLDAGIRAPNIMSVTFADEQASFLAGMTAAMLTTGHELSGIKSPKVIGWLAGEDSPAMRSLVNGYVEGAKLANPEVQVAQALTNSFVNDTVASEKTRWLLDNGVNVIALASGAANTAALALLESEKPWHIALDGLTGKKNALGLIAKRTDKAIYEIMRSAASDRFAGKEILIYDLANGGVSFELTDQFLQSPEPARRDIARRVGEVRQEIINGSIRIPSLRARTLCDCLD